MSNCLILYRINVETVRKVFIWFKFILTRMKSILFQSIFALSGKILRIRCTYFVFCISQQYTLLFKSMSIENADRWNCQNMEMSMEFNWNKYLKMFPIYHFSTRWTPMMLHISIEYICYILYIYRKGNEYFGWHIDSDAKMWTK